MSLMRPPLFAHRQLPVFGALAGLAVGFLCTVVVCALILVGSAFYILIKYPKRRARARS